MIFKNPLKKTPFFVAEISANHNGSLLHAKKLIKIAKKYGADAVKLQTFTPNTLTINSSKRDLKLEEVYGMEKHYGIYMKKHKLHSNGTQNYSIMQKD